MNRRIAAVSIALAAIVGLAACTASPASTSTRNPSVSATESAPDGDGQSVAEACALIRDAVEEAADEFANLTDKDPASVVAAMNAAADKLRSAASEISNEDVAAIVPDLQEMFDKTAEVMQSIVDGDVSKLQEIAGLADDFRATSQRFEQLCAAG